MQMSESYRRGLAERKAWLKANTGKTWADAIEAYKARRLAENARKPAQDPLNRVTEAIRAATPTPAPAKPAVNRTPIQETAPAVPVDEPPAPLHTLSDAEFAQYSTQYWNGAFDRLQNGRPATGSPFFADWNSPLTRKDPS